MSEGIEKQFRGMNIRSEQDRSHAHEQRNLIKESLISFKNTNGKFPTTDEAATLLKFKDTETLVRKIRTAFSAGYKDVIKALEEQESSKS